MTLRNTVVLFKGRPFDPMDLTGVAQPAYDMMDFDFMRRESQGMIRIPETRGMKVTGMTSCVTSFGCPLRFSYCCNSEVLGSK